MQESLEAAQVCQRADYTSLAQANQARLAGTLIWQSTFDRLERF